MGKYVDGFVLVVPKDKINEYKKMAEEGSRMWMENGALEYMECMGEDLIPKEMGGTKPLSFTKIIKAKPNDTVWFSFITFSSKTHRDEVNAKVMKLMEKDMRKDIPIPFDMKHFAFGGFEVIVEGKR